MTDWIVAPAVAAAEAVIVVAAPTVAAALAAGAVIVTEVDVTAVTENAVEVTAVPLESTTLAVMLCAPAEAGTQVIEYGADVSTPMSVAPA